MKKFSSSILLAMAGALFVFSLAYALIGNGDFETGDYTGWTKSSFLNNGFSALPGVGGSDLSTVVTGSGTPLSAADPRTNNNILYPAYGNYTAKVNSENSYGGGGFGRNANTISQTYAAVLNPGDGLAHVRFVYAAAMVEPVSVPHNDEEKPYFRVRVINVTNSNDVVYDFSSYAGEPGKNWQNGAVFSGPDTWKYIDWTYVDLASSPAHPISAGDTVLVEITAAGCSLGGHPGYVYVDEISDGDIAGPSINASGPSTIATGATITYTYNYTNGSSVTIDPTVTINEPVGVTFTSVSDANCSLAGGTVTCNFMGLGAGAGGSFTVDGTVTAAGGSQIAHGDYYIGATGFPTVGGQTVLTDVTLTVPNLTVTASGPATLKPGDNYIFTFNYTTDVAATNTVVTFDLPTHSTYVSDSGSFCSEAGGVVTCNLGSVSSNGSFTVTTAVDKLKKIGATHTLATTEYDITADNVVTPYDGLAAVNATVVTPFADVNIGHFAIDYIQSIWAYGITGGCISSPLSYCPNVPISRAQMAIYIERGIHGGSFDPGTPPITFTDTATNSARYFIEALKADGITGGCGPNIFCPANGILRSQMSIFLLRGKHGSAYTPPPATGTYWLDVTTSTFAAAWAEQLGAEGITSGCSPNYFCPNNTVTRAEMAVLVERTFSLPMPTP